MKALEIPNQVFFLTLKKLIFASHRETYKRDVGVGVGIGIGLGVSSSVAQVQVLV